MPTRKLQFRAGPGALKLLRDDGFRAEQVRTVAGASGGPKWLVLNGIDRAILRSIAPQFVGPVDLIASSIGAWRLACYAQLDPLAALDRFETDYLNQQYSEKPDRDEISLRTREVLERVLGATGAAEILANPVFRFHVMTVRSRGLLQSEKSLPLTAGLMAAAGANLLHRKFVGGFFSRALFHDVRSNAAFRSLDGFRGRDFSLSESNLRDVVLASGAVPLLINAIRDIDGAPPGVYRDGGVIDYHLDLPLSGHDGITLYPHFYGYVRPGWFDKRLPWRLPEARHFDRVLMISPSPEFVAALPDGKIPDRTDFTRLAPAERDRVWKRVVAESQGLGDELLEAIEKQTIAGRLQPIATR